METTRRRLTRRSALVALVAALALLGLCQAALATASSSFTVNEVSKAGATVQIGTWPYDSTSKTYAGAPFVTTLTSTDSQGTALPYVPFSGTDSMPAVKLAAATKGFYVDDLASWVAAQNGIPLGGDTAFDVVCQDTVPNYYWPSPLTLSGVDDGRYWYPSFSMSSSASTAVFDTSTRMPRKALLAICGYSARRYQVSPQNPATYPDLLSALSNIADQNLDSNSLTFMMGQLPGDRSETNLGAFQAKWIQSLTFMPAYLTITSQVAGGGGAATVTTDDGYLKATAGEPVSFTISDLTSGYQIDTVTVTDAGGKPVTVSESSGTYSFTMPASAATIAVNLAAPVPIDLSGATIAPIPNQVYTGSALTPALVATYNGNPLGPDADYSASYAQNVLLGAATATITGIGDCSGSKSATFRIIPRKATLRSVRAGRGMATVRFRRNGGGVSGYRVAYRTKGQSAFRSAGTTRGLSKVVRGLRRGRTYIFKVCAFKVIDGKAYRGAWSRTRSVAIK